MESGRLFISELRVKANKGQDEQDHLTAVNVGNITKKLGLSKGRGGSTGTTYVQWPGNEEAKALYDRYSQKGYPESSDSSETIDTQGESEQDTSTESHQSLQQTSSTENPENTTSTEGSGHTEGTKTYMSREDVPEDGYTDEVERESIQIEGLLN